jgi:glycosyltransferase involved in cell wall biosynthesis
VKNEQQFIRRCLDSVKGKVDQIVVIDTGSSDDTISIAREYTNDIYYMEWINDFSAARNESLKHVVTDYILVLDADEYLETSTNLDELLKSGADYYFVNIYNLMSGDRSMTHTAIRIYKNNIGLYYKYRLHEHLNTNEREDQLLAGYADFRIIHTGYTDEMMKNRDKARRNLSIMKTEVKESPSVYNLFNMGRTYMWLGEHEEAIKFLKEAYPKSKGLTIAPELIASLCRSLGEIDRYVEALMILKEAVKVYPEEVDLRHIQSLFYMEIDYYKDAIACMKTCLKIGDRGISFMEGNGTYIAHLRLAEWYTSRNEYIEGYEHIVKAIKLKNDFVPVMAKYFEIVEKLAIPLDDVIKSTIDLFQISRDIKQLEKVLEVLYQLRHPLLNRLLGLFKINVQENVMAVAHQYDRDYKQAREIWMESPVSEYQNGIDMLLLAIIINDTELFLRYEHILNLNIKEKKLLVKVVSNEPAEKFIMTKHIEDILEKMAIYLMRLQEFDAFERIINYIWLGNIERKIRVCENLAAYGFTEISIDLLIELFKQNPKNPGLIKLLGDVCLRSNYVQDAHLFYTKLVEMCDEYSSYERMYDLYDKSGDNLEKEYLRQAINKKFELCMW